MKKVAANFVPWDSMDHQGTPMRNYILHSTIPLTPIRQKSQIGGATSKMTLYIIIKGVYL